MKFRLTGTFLNVTALINGFLLALWLLHCSNPAFAQATPAPKERPPMKREALLTLTKSALINSCDNPVSPPACMAKTAEICHTYLPIALDQCATQIGAQMPSEIKTGETRQWSSQLGRCIVNNFLVLAGANNIDMRKCPARKQ